MLANANQAVAGIAGRLASAMFVFPITPSTQASEIAAALPNAFQMNSELGSIAAVHGAGHATQTPAATFTSSQGLLLMLPSLYKMAGERVPAVVHVAARQVAGAALSIKCDHSDIILAKQFVAALLISKDAEQAEKDALAAYLLAVLARTPVLHAYDGFLTSHESLKFLSIYDRAKDLFDGFRQQFEPPPAPRARNVGFIADADKVFELTELQAMESAAIVKKIKTVYGFLLKNGVDFPIFTTRKPPAAVEHLFLAAGSSVDVAWHALQSTGNADCLQVRFLRPFLDAQLRAALSSYPNLKTVTVLNRQRSLYPGTEDLSESVRRVLYGMQAGQGAAPNGVSELTEGLYKGYNRYIKLISGVYGIGGREFTPELCLRALDNAQRAQFDNFTLGINDDLEHRSLPPSGQYHVLDLNRDSQQRLIYDKWQDYYNGWLQGGAGDGLRGHGVADLPDERLQGRRRGGAEKSEGPERAERSEECEDSQGAQGAQGTYAAQRAKTAQKPLVINVFALGQEGHITSSQALADALAGLSLQASDAEPRQHTADMFRFAAFNSYFDAKKSNGLARAEIRLGDQYIPPGLTNAEDALPVCGVPDLKCFQRNRADIARSASGGVVLVNCGEGELEEVGRTLGSGTRLYRIDLDECLKDEALAAYPASLTAQAGAACYNAEPGAKGNFSACQTAFRPQKDNFHFAFALACCLEREGIISKQNLQYISRQLMRSAAKFAPVAGAKQLEAQFERVERHLHAAPAGADNGCQASPPPPRLPQPLSAFPRVPYLPHETNRAEQRNVAAAVPLWAAEKCVQCGKCSVYCPHGAIRPYLLDDQEYARYLKIARPGANNRALKVGKFNYVIYSSPRDCTGCNICARHCPTQALHMTPNKPRTNAHEAQLFAYLASVERQRDYAARLPQRPKDSSFSEYGLQFVDYTLKSHSACPGCGEAGYIEMLCKVVLETLHEPLRIVQGTGCPLVYLGEHGSQPFAAKDIFWTNSLFEDTAEVAIGMQFALQHGKTGVSGLENTHSRDARAKDRAEGSKDAKAAPAVWAVMGDGAAYDIDFAGVDFACRGAQNVKILVLDNQSYANTGGQKSSATPAGVKTKTGDGESSAHMDLGRVLMQHENAYVASVSNYDAARTCEIIYRAHEFPGPAVVIAYAPCILHKSGQSDCVSYQKKAVQSGLAVLFEYDPRRPRGSRLRLDSRKTKPAAKMNEKRVRNAELLDRALADRENAYVALSGVL